MAGPKSTEETTSTSAMPVAPGGYGGGHDHGRPEPLPSGPPHPFTA